MQDVFTKAEGQGKPEADVTQEDIVAAVAAVGAGSQRRVKVPEPPAPYLTTAASEPMPATATWADFEVRWRAENEQTLSESYLRAAKQVVTGRTQFDVE